MDMVSFGIGSLITVFAMALFSSERETFDVQTNENEPKINGNLRRVEMSCQTCRKLKYHIEKEPYLFECIKCKRLVDLR